MLWLPAPARFSPEESEPFLPIEQLEYQSNPELALRAYAELSRSPIRAIRAGALLRTARLHRRHGRLQGALQAYRALGGMGDVFLYGMPADLLARRAACDALEAAGDDDRLGREAAAIERDLLHGRWVLDRTTWNMIVRDLERWLRRSPEFAADRALFTALADVLWDEHGARMAPQVPKGKYGVVTVHGVPLTVLFQQAEDALVVLAFAPPVIAEWARTALGHVSTTGTGLTLLAPSGEVVIGRESAPDAVVARMGAADAALPWTVVLDSSAVPAEAIAAVRGRMLWTGLIAILLLLAGGSYFLWRVIRRELAVARLQTDFVSAVSHEFRTPLASLQHITELLEEADDIPQDRRQSFYRSLRRNTGRLNQLVESLLDFARMEAGRRPYEMHPVDAAEFARLVVADIRRHCGASIANRAGHRCP